MHIFLYEPKIDFAYDMVLLMELNLLLNYWLKVEDLGRPLLEI